MESEIISIGDLQNQYDRIDDILDDYLFRIGVEGKNALRFSLLTEEAVRLAKSIIDSSEYVRLWFEGDDKVSYIMVSTKNSLNSDQQEQFISASSSGQNQAKANQTFFDVIRKMVKQPAAATWSLRQYESELDTKRKEDKYSVDAWEDLERSVLAKLSDEIVVSAKDGGVLMKIRKDFV